MKKLFTIIAVFFIAIAAQAQMYIFSHQRVTAMKNGKVIKSIEGLSSDTLFLDGESIQMILAGEFVSDTIHKTEVLKGFVRYSVTGMTVDIPTVLSPEEITILLAPDEKKISYKISYYIREIIR